MQATEWIAFKIIKPKRSGPKSEKKNPVRARTGPKFKFLFQGGPGLAQNLSFFFKLGLGQSFYFYF